MIFNLFLFSLQIQIIQLTCPSVRKIIKIELNQQQFKFATCDILEQQLIKHFQYKGIKISNIHIYYDKKIKDFFPQKYVADFEIDLNKTQNKNKMQIYNKASLLGSQPDQWNYQKQEEQQDIQTSNVNLPTPQEYENKFLNVSSSNINKINEVLHKPLTIQDQMISSRDKQVQQDNNIQFTQNSRFQQQQQISPEVSYSQINNVNHKKQDENCFDNNVSQLYSLQHQKSNHQGQLYFSSNIQLTKTRQQVNSDQQEPQLSQFTHQKQKDTEQKINLLQANNRQQQRKYQVIDPQISQIQETSIIKRNEDVNASNLLATQQQKSLSDNSDNILTSNAIATRVEGNNDINFNINETKRINQKDRDKDNLSISQLEPNKQTRQNKYKDINIQIQDAKEEKIGNEQALIMSKTQQLKNSYKKQLSDSQLGVQMLKNCNKICTLIDDEDSQNSVKVSNKFTSTQIHNQQNKNIKDDIDNLQLISINEEDINKEDQQVQQQIESAPQVAQQLDNAEEIEYISDQIRQHTKDIINLQLCIEAEKKRLELSKQDNQQQRMKISYDQLDEINEYNAQNEKIKCLEKYSQYLNNYIQDEQQSICQLSIKELLQINISFLTDVQILTSPKMIQLFINWTIKNNSVYLYNTDFIEQDVTEDMVEHYCQDDFYITINKNMIQVLRKYKLYEFFTLILESSININKSITQSHRLLQSSIQDDKLSKQQKGMKQLRFSQMFLKQQQLDYVHNKITLQRLQQMYDKTMFTYDDVQSISYDDLYNCQIVTTKIKKLQIVKLLIDFHGTVLLNNEIIIDDFNQLQRDQYDQNFYITFDHDQQLQCIFFVDRFKSDLMMLHVLIQ